MRVHVRLFGSLREALGREAVELELPDGSSAEQAWRSLVNEQPALADRRSRLTTAINRRYGRFEDVLADGDEVVFVPPVSGG